MAKWGRPRTAAAIVVSCAVGSVKGGAAAPTSAALAAPAASHSAASAVAAHPARNPDGDLGFNWL